jgi:outer membrane biosynthesis protein TonB
LLKKVTLSLLELPFSPWSQEVYKPLCALGHSGSTFAYGRVPFEFLPLPLPEGESTPKEEAPKEETSEPEPKKAEASEESKPQPKKEEKAEPKQEAKKQEAKKTPEPQSATAAVTGAREVTRVKMTRARARTAERLKESQNTAAMLTTFNEIDMSAVINVRLPPSTGVRHVPISVFTSHPPSLFILIQ